jgi:hypothetical protein
VHSLSQLLFKDSEPRWDRLRELMTEASNTSDSDYDVTDAIEMLLVFLASDRGASVRESIVEQGAELLDELSGDALEFVVNFASLSARGGAVEQVITLMKELQRQSEQMDSGVISAVTRDERGIGPSKKVTNKKGNKISEDDGKRADRAGASSFASALIKAATPTAVAAKPTPRLVELVKFVQLMNRSGLDGERLVLVVRKVLREPVTQHMVSRMLSLAAEAATARVVRRITGVNDQR